MPFHKIPSTFASQHPDHASVPYWKKDNDPFIKASDETEEVYLAFSELGIEEYKWDWEGKLVDESVVDRLLITYYDYFKQNPLGKEKFLTYRLPNPNVQTEQRLGRAFMGILSASGLTKSLNMPTPPMDEVILPMCDSAYSMIDIQEAFREIANLKHWLFGFQSANLKHIKLIPLFEDVNTIANSDQILAQYLSLHQEKFGYKPEYIRPYVARSDPSLNSGHVATVLAIKIAFSKYSDFEQKYNIKLYPMIGCAALLFRGGLSPDTVDDFIQQYSGVKTVLIQSAFRYDYPKEQAIKAIQTLNQKLPNSKARKVKDEDYSKLFEIIMIFKKPYTESVEKIASIVNYIAKYFPARRERVQHTGLFGYSRGIGKVTLPRAIKFTGSLYSIGLPPSIIGLGRGLKTVKESGLLDTLLDYYPFIKKDYQRTVKFINLENIEKLANKKITINTEDTESVHLAFEEILEDIKLAKSILDISLEPDTDLEKKHQELTTIILEKLANLNHFDEQDKQKKQEIQNLITEAGICRKSLG
jgi:phosphoenolpyruvate carboxylase